MEDLMKYWFVYQRPWLRQVISQIDYLDEMAKTSIQTETGQAIYGGARGGGKTRIFNEKTRSILQKE
jgi:hypothetical protein